MRQSPREQARVCINGQDDAIWVQTEGQTPPQSPEGERVAESRKDTFYMEDRRLTESYLMA